MTNEAVYMAARETNYSNPSLKLCSAPDFKPLIQTLIKHIWQLSWDAISVSKKLKPIKPLIGSWLSSDRDNRFEELV